MKWKHKAWWDLNVENQKFSLAPSFPSPYSWGHHFSSHRPWHYAGILRQPPEKVFLLLQAQTGQEKIIGVASWSYEERNFVEPARKRCPENAGNLSCPLKNLMHKHSRKRRLDENAWNSECALKFSIVACKQLDGNGIMRVCVCVCTKEEKQERVPAHAGCGRPPLSKFNFTPACKHHFWEWRDERRVSGSDTDRSHTAPSEMPKCYKDEPYGRPQHLRPLIGIFKQLWLMGQLLQVWDQWKCNLIFWTQLLNFFVPFFPQWIP